MARAGNLDRAAPARNSSAQHHVRSPALVLRNFRHLPRELQASIYALACRSSPSSLSVADAAMRSRVALDIPTTLSIAQVSKAVNAMICPVLYGNIKIVRPSALLQLHAALKARPQLRALIKSLWLGPKSDLVDTAWPYLCMDGFEHQVPGGHRAVFIRTSLAFTEEGSKALPVWCMPKSAWPMHGPQMDCQGWAVFWALTAAVKDLDVDPYRRGYGKGGQRIGLDSWALRLLQVEAALSLYLLEMRRLEDAHNYPVTSYHDFKHLGQAPSDCNGYGCHHYPDLRIIDGNRGDAEEGEKKGNVPVFKLSRQQLLQFMARPGSAGDQFEYYLNFAREGEGKDALTTYARARLDAHLAGHQGEQPHAANSINDDPEETVLQAQEADRPPSPEPLAARIIPELQTSDGLLHITSSILKMVAPHITNLSLTGCLYMPLCSYTRAPPIIFDQLRCLNVGPSMRYWYSDLFGGRGPRLAFPRLRYMRLCTHALSQYEVDVLVGGTGSMPALKRLEVELLPPDKPGEKLSASSSSIFEVIRSLQAGAGQSHPASLPIDDPGQSSSKVKNPSAGSPLFIEVLLHPDTYKEVLDLAHSSSASLRASWQEGHAPPNDSTTTSDVHVTPSPAGRPSTRKDPEAAVKRLYYRSKTWWELYASKGKVPERSYTREPGNPGVEMARQLLEETRASGDTSDTAAQLMMLLLDPSGPGLGR